MWGSDTGTEFFESGQYESSNPAMPKLRAGIPRSGSAGCRPPPPTNAGLEKMKKLDEAEAEFRKVIEANPSNASALNYLGYMLADRNLRLTEAQQMIQKALELDPGNGAYLDSLGWVYFRLGKLDAAEENLKLAIQKTPRDPTVHDHLGDVLMKEGKLKDAITQWQKSLQEWDTSSQSEQDPGEVVKIQKKLDGAKLRLAKETGKK